ncbi:hypothetical protein AcV7_004123 [Taiwanofungus camphoratus]|nr:hypothetical protein AcV7_004123 [Antrodia cinnamomea]
MSSSLDEGSSLFQGNPVEMSTSSRPNPRRRDRTIVPPMVEVIEISSDDEAPTHNQLHNTVASLRQQLKEVQQEVLRKSQDNDLVVKKLREEVDRLKAEASHRDRQEARSLLSNLDDYISCEICMHTLWTPYALACGHTFCLKCLKDWFNSTFALHMVNHPEYDMQLPRLQAYRGALRDPRLHPLARFQMESYISEIQRRQLHPQYTCPRCRAVVKYKPIEVFALKNVVREIADATGESEPEPQSLKQDRSSAGADGLWDAFFPWT